MNVKLIGRKKELEALREYISSNRSEFVAVYGRRRVGKTFLIRQMAADNFAFYVTGMDNASMKEQLTNFGIALQRHKREENRLRRLNAKKQPITGELADQYVLTK